MAYKLPDGRWVVEPGDLVFWREGDNYRPARVPLITGGWVYLLAGKYDYKRPMGLVEGETEAWRVRIVDALRKVVPREACYVTGNRVFYNWEHATVFVESDRQYRRKAS